ncbi:NB-ARC domain-containing protein [Actinosynnema sp. NPDC053489]|uniref:NB-ARC domain-containing protein n=1 Tax=Actinosynnema sp. NPDC053489 TaxID=3363916 RepID=UPI0037C90264
MSEEPRGGARNRIAGDASGVVQAGHVHGDVHVHARPVARPFDGRVVVGDLPRRPAAFQPRTALVDRLAATAFAVLVGARGTGKTQLAAAYARTAIEDGWRAVVWIDATDHDSTALGWQRLGQALDPNSSDGTVTDVAEAAREWLEGAADRALVVFDNAVDPDVVARWLPRHGPARVVVTTTDHAIADFGTAIALDLFDWRESLAYLRERTGSTDEEGALRLVAEVDRLPLALALAAALVRRQRITYEVCVQRLRAFPVERYLPRHPGDPYPRGVA